METQNPPVPDSTSPPAPEAYPVLVIEDDPDIAVLVRRALAARGYQVSVFASAEDGLAQLVRTEHPILVVDNHLPGMSGLDLVERARQTRDDFEVVMITAHPDVISLTRSVQLGIFRCMAKPFELVDLAAAVAGAANRLFLRLDRRARNGLLERRAVELEAALLQLRESESRRMLSERLASIGQFAAALGHEMNTPLAYVQTNVSLLREDLPDLVHALQQVSLGTPWADLDPELRRNTQRYASEVSSLLDECASGLSVMQRISQDLGSVARYHTDRSEMFDLNEVVRTACRIAGVHQRARTSVSLQLAAAPMKVRGSSGRIAQVVMNLLANAIQAADVANDRPNAVRVRTKMDGAEAVIEVEDSGVGIAPGWIERIFEPFVTMRGSDGGTGIGLGVVRQIVTEHGGRTEVASEVGRGSLFRVRIPAVLGDTLHPPADGALTERSTPTPRRGRAMTSLRLLVVDDDAAMRRALARALSPHHVRLASNGLEAIEAIALEEPDVIVSDLHMPEMNGLDLFERVEREWPHLARRFIFLTGTSSLLDAANERAPTTPLVRKPFAIGDLENAIRACVRPEAKGA